MRYTERQWERRVLDYARFMAESALSHDFLQGLATRFQEDHGGCSGIISYDGNDRLIGPVAAQWDPVWLKLYSQHYRTINPFVLLAHEHKLEDATYVMSRKMPRNAMWRTEYYDGFMEPQSLEYVISTSLETVGQGRTSISVYRGDQDGGDFNSDDVRRVEMLRPFLRQALRLRELHTRGGGISDGSAEALSSPAVLILEDGTVKPLNAAGENYLRLKRLRGLDRSELERVLTEDGAELFKDGITSAGVDGPRVIEAILDDTRIRRAESLAVLFGFTRRETQVAAELLRGEKYSEIGQRLGISVDTVRTFVRFIHRKSGTTSTKRFIRLADDLI